MPKEIVLESWGSGPEDSEMEACFQVGWQPYPIGHVQVVTFARAKVTHDSDTDSAQFVTLDRDGINEAIKNLRRARNQAFGKDE